MRVVKFSNGGYKIKKVFDKELTYSKLLNFENWVNGGLRSFKNQSFKSQLFSFYQKKIPLKTSQPVMPYYQAFLELEEKSEMGKNCEMVQDYLRCVFRLHK